MDTTKKIRSFRDLNVWKEGHVLVLMVYKATEEFPKRETYSLIDQMRRAAVSITSNIAEGFSRRGLKEKIQFYAMSQGSLTELYNQVIVSRDVGYLSGESLTRIESQLIIVNKLINGLIKGAKKLHSTV